MAQWSPWDCLPGVYVFLVALLAARALRRWFDPLPASAATFFGALLVLLGPQLMGGKTLLPIDNLRGSVPFRERPATQPHGNLLQGDLLLLIAPLAEEMRSDLLDGRWPLWNEHAGIGMPLLADPHAQAFQPLVLLSYPFDPIAGAAVTAAFRILCALAFTFLFLSRRGCSPGPSLAGAFAFGLGGFVLLWLGWSVANVAALFPLLLYAQERVIHRGARRDEVLFAIALGAFVLAGHPETVLMGLVVAAAFAGYDLRRLPSARRPALGRLALVAALTAAWTAPVWVPTAAYLPETLRQATLAAGPAAAANGESARGRDAPGGATPLARSWVPVLAPNAFGNSRFVHYWGGKNTNEDASGFAGTAALLLAGLALYSRRRDRLPGEALALAVCAGVLFLLALPEGWQSGFRDMPLLGALSAHGGRRSLLFLGFCLAFLAASSLERARRRPPARWLVASLALLLGGLLAWAYLAHPHPRDPEILKVLRIGWLHWQLRFLLAAALILAFVPRRKLAAYAIALLLAAELCLAHGPANPPMPRLERWPTPPPLEHLLAEALPGDRLIGLGNSLPPNLASLYGLSDLRVYNPMAPAAYARLLAPALESPGADAFSISRPSSHLLGFLGARWLLAPPGAVLGEPFELAVEHESGWLYRRPDALPRIVSPGDGGGRGTGSAAARPLGAEIELWGPRLRVTAPPLDGELVAATVFQHSEGNLFGRGGWKGLADGLALGDERPSAPGLEALLVLRPPAGARRLDLLYRPPGFLFGCWLAALGAAAAGLRWIAPASYNPSP